MKRFIAAAALAAAAVPTFAGAQPIASETACGVGMLGGQGDKDCVFLATANTRGLAGVVDGTWKLSHLETTARCVEGRIVVSTDRVTDAQGAAGPVAEAQRTFVAGITYKVEMTGNGGIVAGGPSGGAPNPTAAEPKEKPLDRTNGAVAGNACTA